MHPRALWRIGRLSRAASLTPSPSPLVRSPHDQLGRANGLAGKIGPYRTNASFSRRHPFSGLLTLTFLGLLCRQSDFDTMARWADRHGKALGDPLGFTREEAPRHQPEPRGRPLFDRQVPGRPGRLALRRFERLERPRRRRRRQDQQVGTRRRPNRRCSKRTWMNSSPRTRRCGF